ncbi:protein phosphatase [Roseivivax marinus]|uniref:PP2C family protein-serine/threonine phosphatase n=1 Tax=Roseivivax marinus TaxID=1379903 RepID=UPI0008BD3ABA|nr:SpoIIE family protein phosphatase [Roseivivax marinus]SEL54589.1 protein phosphatase [Roseivivax marinus]
MTYNDFLSFETGQASDVGLRREVNEDGFLSSPESGLWLVADGMGGHAAGDFASQTIVRELVSIGRPGSSDDLRARFLERLSHANLVILEHANLLGRGTIGSTVVSLLVHGRDYACIWSGDSRAYLFRAGRLTQITRDHTEVRALLDAGTITEEEARHWPRKNVITRAIGVTDTPECDTVEGQAREGDTFLLCSDGLTEHLEDHEIANLLGEALPPQAICDALVRETLARGARDNVTVVVMRCGPAPEGDLDRVYAGEMDELQ